MAFKKRLATFISNWFGVIIATIIVAFSATFGGLYLYARSNVYNATNYATQAFNTMPDAWIRPIDTVEDPPGAVYQITLQTHHISDGLIVNITISDVTIKIGSYEFDVSQDGEWTKSVMAGTENYVTFEGSFTIDTITLDDLKSQDSVDIVIQGQITSNAKYRWVSRTATETFDLDKVGGAFH